MSLLRSVVTNNWCMMVQSETAQSVTWLIPSSEFWGHHVSYRHLRLNIAKLWATEQQGG